MFSNLLQSLRDFPAMCRPDGAVAARWLEAPTAGRLSAAAGMILLGGGMYGWTLGLWRSPEMGWYVAAKLPCLLLGVCVVNGALNGMAAQLLGSGFSFRQTALSTLLSFGIFSLIAAALAPVAMGLALCAAGPQEAGGQRAYAWVLVANTLVIAIAGLLSHARFFPALQRASARPAAALQVFLAWLAGNLFIGAQLSWNLRPFFGHASSPVEFLRPNWNEGNFYEELGHHLATLAPGPGAQAALILLAGAALALALAWLRSSSRNRLS